MATQRMRTWGSNSNKIYGFGIRHILYNYYYEAKIPTRKYVRWKNDDVIENIEDAINKRIVLRT